MYREKKYLKIEGDEIIVTFCEQGPDLRIIEINNMRDLDIYFKESFLTELKERLKKESDQELELEIRHRKENRDYLNQKAS